MRMQAGTAISTVAGLGLLLVLAWAYVPQSVRDVNLYYASGLLNPLLAGLLAIAVLVVFAARRGGYLSAEAAAGVVLALSLFAVLVVVVWAVTARVDVFRAPGWAFPAQRWVLVGLAVLLGLGALWHAWGRGLLAVVR